MNNFHKPTYKKIQSSQYKFKYMFLLLGLFLISLPANSNDSALQKCIDTDDSSERLSCFDEFFKENKTMQQALAIPKKQEVTKMTEKDIEDYGLAKQKEDFSITAKIVKVNKRGNYKIYVILDNNHDVNNSKIFETDLKVGDELLNYKNERICIKIDVEGHEHLALLPFFKSAQKSLFPNHIVIEHTSNSVQIFKDLMKFLSRIGYKIILKTRSNYCLTLIP